MRLAPEPICRGRAWTAPFVLDVILAVVLELVGLLAEFLPQLCILHSPFPPRPRPPNRCCRQSVERRHNGTDEGGAFVSAKRQSYSRRGSTDTRKHRHRNTRHKRANCSRTFFERQQEAGIQHKELMTIVAGTMFLTIHSAHAHRHVQTHTSKQRAVVSEGARESQSQGAAKREKERREREREVEREREREHSVKFAASYP